MTSSTERTMDDEWDVNVALKNDRKKPVSCLDRIKTYFNSKNKVLTLFTFIGIILGFIVGFSLSSVEISDSALLWIGLPGELYMRMLKAVILPLIISSVIVGAASVDPKANGRISAVALAYIIITNFTGSLLGLIFALIIRPGSDQLILADSASLDTQNLQTEDIFADLIRNLVPDNIVTSAFQKSSTVYKLKVQDNGRNTSMRNASYIPEYTRSVGTVPGTNILGLIILCALLGMAAGRKREAAEPFIKFFKSVEIIISEVLGWIIWYTPIGVASLIARAIAGANDVASNFTSLGYFVLTVVVGIAVYEFILLPIVIFANLRINPYKFNLTTVKAQFTACVALSSAVAIPDMFQCVEEKHHVDRKVSRFVVPLAVTLNRDGSALFICVTAIYIGQITGNLDSGTIILMGILAFVGSLAIPAIPSASIVTLLIVLSSLSIPPVNIGLIIALEWFTDRLRSMVNSYGCIICTVITHRWTKQYLEESTEMNSQLQS